MTVENTVGKIDSYKVIVIVKFIFVLNQNLLEKKLSVSK